MRIDTRVPQLAALVESAEPFPAFLANNWAINRGNFWFLLCVTSALLNLVLIVWLVAR